ncbi:hypothetical protein Dimus_011343, partial [Dionaea muscipula]
PKLEQHDDVELAAETEDVIEEKNPKDDAPKEASRGEDLIENEHVITDEDEIERDAAADDADKVNDESKSIFFDEVLKEVMASIGKDNNPKVEKYWDMVVYQDPVTSESSQPTTHIHDHFEHVIKIILDAMDQQNEGIIELYVILDSKIFTDNKTERLTMEHLREAKAYLEGISEQLRLMSISLKKTIMDVADLIFEKNKD